MIASTLIKINQLSCVLLKEPAILIMEDPTVEAKGVPVVEVEPEVEMVEEVESSDSENDGKDTEKPTKEEDDDEEFDLVSTNFTAR